MIILIEGGEGAGKTTVAHRLEKEHGFTYLKFPTPDSDAQKFILDTTTTDAEKATMSMLDIVTTTRKHINERVVMDRGLWSIGAYQGVDVLTALLELLKPLDVVRAITNIIYLDVDPSTGLEREAVKNSMSLKSPAFHVGVHQRFTNIFDACQGNYNEINSDFNRLSWMPWTKNITSIDTNHNNIDKTYNAILEELELV